MSAGAEREVPSAVRRAISLGAVALLWCAAVIVDRAGDDEAVIGASGESTTAVGSNLTSLGPLQLIHDQYEDDLVVDCLTNILSHTITTADLTGIGPATITGANFYSNGANWWVNFNSWYASGEAHFIWFSISSDGCTTDNNPAGQVQLTLSSGDTYMLTILANPV